MVPVQVSGQAIGTCIAVTDSIALAALSQQGIAVGTQVWNAAVGSYFTLTVSSAGLVTDQVVAVSGIDGLRWIITTAVLADGSVTTAKLASGAVTAAKIATIAQDVWFNAQKAAMVAAIPQLTGFDYLRPAQDPNGAIASTIAADPHLEGGGIGVASDTTFLRLTSTTVFQDPKANKWALVFRGKFPANAGGVTSLFGMINAGSLHYNVVGVLNLSSATKFVLQAVGSTTTTTAASLNSDTAMHDFMLTGDGTTMTLYVDGVSVASQAVANMAASDPMAIAMFTTVATTPGVCVQKVAYGYVAP